jgi:hypothetical protein
LRGKRVDEEKKGDAAVENINENGCETIDLTEAPVEALTLAEK